MKSKHWIIALCIMFALQHTSAQVSIDGEFRPRSEYRSGYKKPLADTLNPAFLTLQRTRLTVDYKTKILNTRITLQDARIWGESTNQSSTSKVELFEAWGEYLFATGLSAKFGRQVLNYDDQRLLAASNWSNTGNAHDVLLFKYKPAASFQSHAGFAYNNSKDTLMEVNYAIQKKLYKTMGFIWLSKAFENGLTISGIAIEEGLQKTNDYEVVYPRLTAGGNLIYMNDSLKYSIKATAYIQKGKSTTFDNLNAYMAAIKAGYKFSKSIEAIVGFDYYSGTKPDEAAGESNTFNKLYGSNHTFEGYLDYWTSIPKSGLMDLYAGINAKLTPKLSGEVTCHRFNLAENHIINNVEIDKNMGTELDVIFNYAINKEMAMQAGYCRYFNSSATDDYFKQTTTPCRESQWAYVMMTLKPNFYKTPQPENK